MKSAEEISQRLIEEAALNLSQFIACRYIVDRYIASLQQLTIAIYPMAESKGKYVTFRGVKYMQLPPYWQEATFQLATREECLTFLESVGVEVVEDVPYLFYVQLPTSRVNIVFHSVRISETNPWDEE
jgi:hypothetical protein